MNNRARTLTPIALLLAAGVIAGAALTGCAGTEGPPPPPTVALLVDTGQGAAAHDQDVSLLLAKATELEARVLIDGVGDEAGPTDITLVSDGANTLARTKDLEVKSVALRDALTTIEKAIPSGTLDLFVALKDLGGTLHAAPSAGPVDVVLLSTMVNTAEPANLAAPGALDDPAVVLNTLATAGLIPDCRGWSFHAVDPGDPAHPDVNDSHLEMFWRAYAQRCGGALVAWSPTLAEYPGSRTEVALADTRQMSIVRTETETTVVLDSITFGGDSARLSDAAKALLADVADLIGQTAGAVTIVGHTDLGATGYPGGLPALSLDRAEAVKAELIAAGVDGSRITAEGKAADELLFPEPQTDEEHSANRRVVITFGATQ